MSEAVFHDISIVPVRFLDTVKIDVKNNYTVLPWKN